MAQVKASEVEQPEKKTARLIPEERLKEILNILLPYGYSHYYGTFYKLMKANAPKRIWINSPQDLPCGTVDSNSVEYVRKDAFIEKAAQWFKENLLNHTYVYEGEVGIGMDVFLEQFKKAMKL